MTGGPTVFVSVPHGAAAGNILRTGLVQHLLDAHPECEIVLLSPMAADEAFVREFQRARILDLPPHRPAGLEGRLMALVQASYIDSGVTESVRMTAMSGTRCWNLLMLTPGPGTTSRPGGHAAFRTTASRMTAI